MGRRHGDHAAAVCDVSDRRAFDLAGGQKEYEPALLLPMGFGAIMVNLPLSGVINQVTEGIGETQGIIQWLFETTISASEALPILLFIGIGAMIDFGPLLSQPIMFYLVRRRSLAFSLRSVWHR